MIRLGLIGGNIRASRSPALHRECGRLHGLAVSYQLMIPAELGLSFDETFDRCRDLGLTGFNVTLPYKEVVLRRVTVADPVLARIGAVNTVCLRDGGAIGYNTDYTGFIAAYRNRFSTEPGIVALIGSGGVGKAIGFALVELGATEIRVVDTSAEKAAGLALALTAAGARRAVAVADAGQAMRGADGAINCTPLGMEGYPGSPARDVDFKDLGWAFDAVYTPEFTPFRAQAQAAGVEFMSGWDLYFYQGIGAFQHFTGVVPTRIAELRECLRGLAP
jgi:shikimate dehydrogenase